jgi:hypothetical protein
VILGPFELFFTGIERLDAIVDALLEMCSAPST